MESERWVVGVGVGVGVASAANYCCRIHGVLCVSAYQCCNAKHNDEL